MPKLTIVPPSAPGAAEKLRQRIKRAKPADVLQCRCGSRSFYPTLTGAHLKAGKVTGGTKGLACMHCKANVI